MAGEDEGQEQAASSDDGQIGARVGRLEQAIGEIRDTIRSALGGAHGQAQAATEARLGASATAADAAADVASEVQRELDRRADADKQAEREQQFGKLQADVAELRERPPAPPQRRVERIMGWH